MWNTDDFGETWYVTMTTGTCGATIFYKIGQNGYITPTHNGGQATNGTSVYNGAPIPVPVGSTCHFRAVAYKAGMIDSVMADLIVDNVENGGNAPAAGQRTVFYNNDPLNRTSMIDNGTETVYGPTSGVNQYMSVSGHTLAYDANFNLSGYDAWSYVYDAEKRLISASGSGTAMGQGHSAQFVYDGLGRCVKRTIDNVTTLITYDGWKPVAEWNGAGNLVAWNLYGPGADEILVRYSANVGHLYYHLDAHGHVRFLLNGNGEVIEKYSYDAFGQPKIMDGNGSETTTTSYENRFLFTGREYLSALGLYDYRHRAYHPGLGRFLQIDPLGLQIEGAKLSVQQAGLYVGGTAPATFASSELNLFRYCHNDPVNGNDPFGLEDTVTIEFVPGIGKLYPQVLPDRVVDAACLGCDAASLVAPNGGLKTTATKDKATGDIHVKQRIKIETWIPESQDKAGKTPELLKKELLRVAKFREGLPEAERKANDLAKKGFADEKSAEKLVEESTKGEMLKKAKEGKLKWDLFGGKN